MKTNSFAITLVALCALAATLYAATREWSIPIEGQTFQIIADGKGGCAFITIGTGMVGKVVWVDKKGMVKYEDTISVPALYVGIIKCTKKELVYSKSPASSFKVIQVDKKGQVTELSDPGKLLLGPFYPYPSSQPSDRKGFFALSAVTNPPPPSFELIRYKSK